jgi:hypothetical protein
MLIKPFTATVDANGHATITVGHNQALLKWKVFQVGLALGQVANFAQVAGHVNGIPLASTVIMQPSVFASLPGQAPYAMESFMVGPPYIYLRSGDQFVIGVINATSGDTFTVGAYVEEMSVDDDESMGT